MSTETTTSLRLTRIIKADPQSLFEAFTKEEHLKQWSCPEGGTVAKAEVDLRIDGAFCIVMDMGKGKTHTARGVYTEIDPPRRLVYTWDWDDPENRMGGTTITVEFNPVGENTEVVFSHDLFPTLDLKTAHEEGWTSCLNRLEVLFP